MSDKLPHLLSLAGEEQVIDNLWCVKDMEDLLQSH